MSERMPKKTVVDTGYLQEVGANAHERIKQQRNHEQTAVIRVVDLKRGQRREEEESRGKIAGAREALGTPSSFEKQAKAEFMAEYQLKLNKLEALRNEMNTELGVDPEDYGMPPMTLGRKIWQKVGSVLKRESPELKEYMTAWKKQSAEADEFAARFGLAGQDADRHGIAEIKERAALLRKEANTREKNLRGLQEATSDLVQLKKDLVNEKISEVAFEKELGMIEKIVRELEEDGDPELFSHIAEVNRELFDVQDAYIALREKQDKSTREMVGNELQRIQEKAEKIHIEIEKCKVDLKDAELSLAQLKDQRKKLQVQKVPELQKAFMSTDTALHETTNTLREAQKRARELEEMTGISQTRKPTPAEMADAYIASKRQGAEAKKWEPGQGSKGAREQGSKYHPDYEKNAVKRAERMEGNKFLSLNADAQEFVLRIGRAVDELRSGKISEDTYNQAGNIRTSAESFLKDVRNELKDQNNISKIEDDINEALIELGSALSRYEKNAKKRALETSEHEAGEESRKEKERKKQEAQERARYGEMVAKEEAKKAKAEALKAAERVAAEQATEEMHKELVVVDDFVSRATARAIKGEWLKGKSALKLLEKQRAVLNRWADDKRLFANDDARYVEVAKKLDELEKLVSRK